MIDVGNDRDVPDVVLLVHQLANLLDREAHHLALASTTQVSRGVGGRWIIGEFRSRAPEDIERRSDTVAEREKRCRFSFILSTPLTH